MSGYEGLGMRLVNNCMVEGLFQHQQQQQIEGSLM